MVKIAVTGGIACGKTVVGSILAKEGVAVCEADELAHRLMVSGSPVFHQIVETFGTGILDTEGRMDRRVLGRRVFSDSGALALLNAIVHPGVRSAWEAWLVQQDPSAGVAVKRSGVVGAERVAAVIVPLLYEGGFEGGWDAVICVGASEPLQVQRLLDRGLSEAEARARISAQMPLPDKIARADFVVMGEGSLRLVKEQTERALGGVLERRYGTQKQ